MASSFKKSAVLVLLMAFSAESFAKPAHVLFHVSKKVVYPLRHPLKSSHNVWKFLAEVF